MSIIIFLVLISYQTLCNNFFYMSLKKQEKLRTQSIPVLQYLLTDFEEKKCFCTTHTSIITEVKVQLDTWRQCDTFRTFQYLSVSSFWTLQQKKYIILFSRKAHDSNVPISNISSVSIYSNKYVQSVLGNHNKFIFLQYVVVTMHTLHK